MDISRLEYDNAVFINCPFDEEYTPLFHAIIFTVYRCGFLPVSALGEDNALENRLSKIQKCIAACRYCVHDLSRIEINSTRLPRFNMPFELGLFFGAKYFGNKKQVNKNAIIFDRDPFRYQQFISDLNGVDIKAHQNNTNNVIQKIRDWLSISSRRMTIPGHTLIQKEFDSLLKILPQTSASLGLSVEGMSFNDFCLIAEETVRGIA